MSGDDGSKSGTAGSGTRPEGHTRRDPPDRRAGQSSATGDPLLGAVLLDRYRVTRRVGSGGMGTVYAAEQVSVGREVALKILRSDLMGQEGVQLRFRREAEIIARLSHPSTIRLIDYGETPDGRAVMVMELLEGVALNDRLRAEGPMEVEEVLRIGEEVARALAEAHREGLVHRDLKPANIFLVNREEVRAKVLDFGIARIMDEESTRMTADGQIFGTPRYMSPEQAVSTATVGPLSDVYSLALILYEALVGQPPFVAETSLQYMSAHSTQTPPKLRARFPAAPAELEALIDACLEKDPGDRPGSATEVAEALARIRAGFSASEPVATRWSVDPEPEPVEPPSRGFAVALAGLGLLLLLGGVAVVAGLGGSTRVESLDASVVVAVGDGAPGSAGVGVPSVDAADGGQPTGASGREDLAALEAAPGEEGAPAAQPDAGAAQEADLGTRPVPRRRKPKSAPSNPPVGTGAVTGPRGLVIPGEALEGPDLATLAQGCRMSQWRGMGRLTTRGCPEGCAVLVDDICAGLTPAKGRAVGPGPRRVAVVCKGKVVKRVPVTFAERRTRVVRCR